MKSATKAVTISAAAFVMAVGAASPVALAQAEMEKCYGVAVAGKNDCSTATSSCAGTSKTDRQADAFIAVPKGTCAKISGGSLEPKK